MRRLSFSILIVQQILAVLVLLLFCHGCNSTEETVAASIGGTALAAHSPNNEIEQIYYLGVFDPQEQVPPTVYRVRVHGQASAISFMRFSSGWVPATLIDPLDTNVEFDKDTGRVKITPRGEQGASTFETGRRLVLFGPEGFREAPADHRLVILMSGNPEAFFKAISDTLGKAAGIQAQQADPQFMGKVLNALVAARNEQQQLAEIGRECAVKPAGKGEKK